MVNLSHKKQVFKTEKRQTITLSQKEAMGIFDDCESVIKGWSEAKHIMRSPWENNKGISYLVSSMWSKYSFICNKYGLFNVANIQEKKSHCVPEHGWSPCYSLAVWPMIGCTICTIFYVGIIVFVSTNWQQPILAFTLFHKAKITSSISWLLWPALLVPQGVMEFREAKEWLVRSALTVNVNPTISVP